jgi:hypothetical protein
LWTHKRHFRPYIGIVDGRFINDPELIIEKRSRMKIFLVNPDMDIPVQKISLIITEALRLCELRLLKSS